ncbi:MAG TPA: cytochrome c oxidase assembly protein [Lacisediminihabitans sp.]|uniref:cytochrome c oxidase assembly protein n=1 Tax=Lacisediminihabitans sp. TaxID=2787631 RepID=UPI002ED9BF6C
MPRLVRIAGPAALLLVVGLVSLLAALRFGGAADAPLVFDPGAVVRYGLPVATMLVNLGVAVTIGSLVLVCFALSDREKEFVRALDIAAAAAAFWTIASAATGFLTFMNYYTKPITLDSTFGAVLGQFITGEQIGQAWLIITLVAAAVTVLCFAVRNRTLLLFVTLFSGVGLVPMALQGHSADSAGHDAAVTSLGLHLAFAAVWLGGLLTIVLLRSSLESGRIGPVLSRYSSLAIVCFIVVAASGYVNAALRVGTFGQLLTPYGILVLVKVFALGALGIFGLIQRRFLVARMQKSGNGGSRFFWGLVAAELAFMGIASGVAAALAKTQTPVGTSSTPTTPAWILTQAPLPPELTFARYFTEWNFDLLWILVVGFLAFFYLAGVWRLRRRGDSWPWYRTVLWLAGLALLFYVTCGGVNLYEKYLFSAHMLGHMILGMMIPLLLVPAAPVTLALRTIAKRTDGSRGPREWIMLATHSRVAGVLTNPVVAAVVFAGSLWAFYYTPLFSWATTDHIGHTWMIVHFLIAGYLFIQSMIGVDPVPRRAPYPLRLLILLATMAFHAFFGLSLMTGTGLLLADWYGAMGRTWGPSAIADQQTGGGIAWSVGEIPTVILAIVVAIMWSRSDAKDAKRLDRKADRDGDADLIAYNRMLAERARRD